MAYIKAIGAPDAPHQFSKPTPPSALNPEAAPEGEAPLVLTTAQTELHDKKTGERKDKP